MLAFKDVLNSDNPVSEAIDLESLNTWYYALLLIGSNFFGAPLIIYCHKRFFFLLSVAAFVSVIFSLLYHTCQTTRVCFGLHLSTLTLADHISAGAFMMMLILFVLNLRDIKQMKNDTRKRALKYRLLAPPVKKSEESVTTTISSYHANFDKFLNPVKYKAVNVTWQDSSYEAETDLTYEQVVEVESRKIYYNYGYSNGEPNDLYDAWSVYIMYTSIFIVIMACLAHPFSMEAFVIAICFGLAAIFFKIVIIDEGIPVGFYHRISLPELLLGVFLMAISLVFYILDCYWEYGYMHSLWHVCSYLGAYFIVIGLSKNTENWYSPLNYIYKKTLFCCLRVKGEND